MIEIFAATHRIIADNMCKDIVDVYGIKLDKGALSWGSVAPDILPKYRFHRHYKDESINYIANEITKLIFMYRNVDFDRIDPLTMKFMSKNIGVISHYLSDFVCLPHAKRWTFIGSMRKHLKYESQMDEFTPNHNFKKNVINVDNIDIYISETVDLKAIAKDYIEDVVEEYSLKEGMENDLDFALSLNLNLTYFVIDSIESYKKNVYNGMVFEF